MAPQTTEHERALDALSSDLDARIAGMDWASVDIDLNADGHATLPGLLTPQQCESVRTLYPESGLFRKRVVMSAHAFGEGEYQYFAKPLPEFITRLRSLLYRRPAAGRLRKEICRASVEIACQQ